MRLYGIRLPRQSAPDITRLPDGHHAAPFVEICEDWWFPPIAFDVIRI